MIEHISNVSFVFFCCFHFFFHICTTYVNEDDELANAITEAEAKAPEDLTERDKMALLGRPKIGDITRAQLRIKESKEFKVIL